MPEPRNINLKEIVINLPCPILLRTKLYITLRCLIQLCCCCCMLKITTKPAHDLVHKGQAATSTLAACPAAQHRNIHWEEVCLSMTRSDGEMKGVQVETVTHGVRNKSIMWN